jgi:hypothetical protein
VTDPSVARDRWTAAHCRALGRLFSICGEAGAVGDPPDVALALTSLAGQFAWHAELFGDLLAETGDGDATALVARPVAGLDASLDRLADAAAAGDVATVCVGLARAVVPRLSSSVAAERARTDARLDGPRARALTLVARDAAAAVARLEPLAERALARPGAFDALARGVVEVERDLVDGGVAAGLVGAEMAQEDLTPPVE